MLPLYLYSKGPLYQKNSNSYSYLPLPIKIEEIHFQYFKTQVHTVKRHVLFIKNCPDNWTSFCIVDVVKRTFRMIHSSAFFRIIIWEVKQKLLFVLSTTGRVWYGWYINNYFLLSFFFFFFSFSYLFYFLLFHKKRSLFFLMKPDGDWKIVLTSSII